MRIFARFDLHFMLSDIWILAHSASMDMSLCKSIYEEIPKILFEHEIFIMQVEIRRNTEDTLSIIN